MRAPNRFQGPGPVLPVFLIACLVTVLAPAATFANPLPAGTARLHVQPVNDGFCSTNLITTCAEVVQHLDQSGPLEFDLFFECLMSYPPMPERLTFELVWPVEWQLIEFENCVGGALERSEGPGSLAAQISFGGPTPMSGSFFLVGRVVLDVTAPGQVEISQASWREDGFDWEMGTWPAHAGPVDCWCWHDCSTYGLVCGATFVQSSLVITVPAGEEGQGHLDAWVRFRPDGSPCYVDWTASYPWIYVHADWIDDYQRSITVTVDAGMVGPGTYEAQIFADSICQACIPVTVYVTSSQSAPEGDREPETRRLSWGAVKEGYRE